MAIEQHFYMDTTAARHELRDVLIDAGLGFQAQPDWQTPSGRSGSGAINEATVVSILDDLGYRNSRPDNGVIATRSITFRDRRAYLTKPEHEGQYDRDVTLGVMALLRAYPEADAYWDSYDAEIPTLLRREGRLVLAQALTENNEQWDAERQPYRAMVDLPYVVEPLGPWPNVSNESYVPYDPAAEGHRET